MSQKYAIAKNRGVNAFFTKTSAYDRPQWVSESQASTFHTAEMAETALRKLLKHGAYEARVVVLSEAIELELPDDAPAQGVPTRSNAIDNQNAVDANNSDLDDPEATADDDNKMVAQIQITTSAVPANFQAGSEDDLEHEEDSLVGVEDPAALPPPDDDVTDFNPNADPSVRMESAEMPTRPGNDPVASSNKDTVLDVKKPAVITYKDPSKSPDCFTAPVNDNDENSISVPADVKADLKKAIADFKKQADFANTVDDTRSSFCLTVVAAFERLQELLSSGTVGDLKQAQIFMTTWMNAITTNLPASVQKFVLSGGRKDTLKDLFDKAWASKKEQL